MAGCSPSARFSGGRKMYINGYGCGFDRRGRIVIRTPLELAGFFHRINIFSSDLY